MGGVLGGLYLLTLGRMRMKRKMERICRSVVIIP